MRSRPLLSVVLALLVLVPFVALLVAVPPDGAPLAMDRWWADAVDGWQTPWLATVERLISDLGGGFVGGVVLPGAIALLVWRLRSARAALAFMAVEVASVVAVELVKHVAARPRPPSAMMPGATDSFPSGHVTNAAAMTLLLAILLRGPVTRAIAVIWPVLMAFSRTYLGLHWLSDVVAAASLGLAVVLVCRPFLLSWVDGPVRGARRPSTAGFETRKTAF
ncbi:phosphatase PAP2 family protein [Luteimicrobium sp. DT211]|uniref:phosphatase PAP2 family protein n=1 Tax=Luteimicrobium sp. DT211 TaxID=3393412 RepID=UPI003CF34268